MLSSFLSHQKIKEGAMSDPSDWVQFYQQSISRQPPPPLPAIMYGEDSTVVSTTVSPPGNPQGSGSSRDLNPEGRVSKPIRRRSRASRRTPTTLLNTDTTNFRAMVQQFTGGPSAPFSSNINSHPGASTNIGFTLGSRQQHQVNHPTPVMVPSGYHLQFQQQPQYNHQHQQQQQQQQGQYMFPMNNNTSAADHMFLQRLTGEAAMDGFSSQVVQRDSSSSNENRSSNYRF